MDNILSKTWFWILFVCIIIAGGIFYSGVERETISDDEVALKINEIEFSRKRFEDLANRLRNDYQMYEMSISDEELKEEIINSFVQEAFIFEYAKEKGIEPTQEEIDVEINNLMTSMGVETEAELLEQLNQFGIKDRADLEANVKLQIKAQKIFSSFIDDAEVSSADILVLYNLYSEDAKERGEEFPEYEEVESYLSESLKEEEANAVIFQKIEEFKNSAEIQILIDFDEDVVEELDEVEDNEQNLEDLEIEGGDLEEEIIELEQ